MERSQRFESKQSMLLRKAGQIFEGVRYPQNYSEYATAPTEFVIEGSRFSTERTQYRDACPYGNLRRRVWATPD